MSSRPSIKPVERLPAIAGRTGDDPVSADLADAAGYALADERLVVDDQ
jgi:hypothetical protein